MPKPEWEVINVRRADKVTAKLEKLERAIEKEKGVKVNRADVIRIVVDEAMKARGLK